MNSKHMTPSREYVEAAQEVEEWINKHGGTDATT